VFTSKKLAKSCNGLDPRQVSVKICSSAAQHAINPLISVAAKNFMLNFCIGFAFAGRVSGMIM
jgi:hypothetical protein